MEKKTILPTKKIISLYEHNKEKGIYWVANQLNLNKNSVQTVIYKKYPPKPHNLESLEEKILELIDIYPFTGTKRKISKKLNISIMKLNGVIKHTNNKLIKKFFKNIKTSTSKVTDQDIFKILEGSKKGIGNDLMGEIIGVDGVSIRNIRKKFLTKEEYNLYHSIDRFYMGDYNSYFNDRGDKFLSTWEEKVADYLFKREIKYFTNVRLSYAGKNYSPDLYLPKSRVFIEVFGMSNISSYISKMDKKIEYYNNNNIKCLFLFEEDFINPKKQPVEIYKLHISNFLNEIENNIYNKHLKKIHIYEKI